MSLTSLYWEAEKRLQLSRSLLCHSLSLGIYKRLFGENQKACLTPSILFPKRSKNIRSEKNYNEENQCRMTLSLSCPANPSSCLNLISFFSPVTSTCLIPPVYTPFLLDFNFGAAPIGSEPTLVMLLLKNKGVVPVEW